MYVCQENIHYIFVYTNCMLNNFLYSDEQSFRTNTIMGGGSNVQWSGDADENDYTFLLRDDPNALKRRYLKIEVFDYESATKDKSLGFATIVTKKLMQRLGKTYYARLNLYENDIETGYRWAGTVDISATFKKISIDQVDEITRQNIEKIEKRALWKHGLTVSNTTTVKNSKDNNQRTRQSRGMTDQLVLGRFGSRAQTAENAMNFEYIKMKTQREAKLKKKQSFQGNDIQSIIIDSVLFISLILSGVLYFGAMNEYEVMRQKEFMQINYNKSLSIIDPMRYGIVTVTTVGYGDFYPQTTGGRIFATFFIIFGVSLLARVLNFGFIRLEKKFNQRKQLKAKQRIKFTWDQMCEWDINGDGKISAYEFLRAMLIREGQTDIGTIEEIMNLFDKYDVDKDGTIQIDELKKRFKENAQKIQKQIAENEREKGNDNATINDDEVDNYYSENDDDDDKFEHGEFEYALSVEVHGCDHLKEFDTIIDDEDDLWKFIKGWIGFLAFITLGAMIFSFIEQRNYGDMLWMVVVTVCTVGYGDIYPQTSVGKIFNGFYIALSVVLFGIVFGTSVNFIFKQQELLVKKTKKQEELWGDIEFIREYRRAEFEAMSSKKPKDIKTALKMKDLMEAFHFNTILSILWPDKSNNKDNNNKGSNTTTQYSPKPKEMESVIEADEEEKLIANWNDKDDEKHNNTLNEKDNIVTNAENHKSHSKPKQSEIFNKLDTIKSSKNLALGIFDNEDIFDKDDENEIQESDALVTQNGD